MIISILRCTKQYPALGKLQKPFPGDGKADIQLHLIANKHHRISLAGQWGQVSEVPTCGT